MNVLIRSWVRLACIIFFEERRSGMDLFTAMKERRSCRNFLPDPIDEATIEKILESATWAPSPLNSQPWEFIVVTNKEIKEKIFSEGERCRTWALEKSGWKWLGSYPLDFLRSSPVIIAVIGDPKKSAWTCLRKKVRWAIKPPVQQPSKIYILPPMP